MVVPKRELLSVIGSKMETFFHTSSTTNLLEFLDTLSFCQTLLIYFTSFFSFLARGCPLFYTFCLFCLVPTMTSSRLAKWKLCALGMFPL